MSVPAQWFFNDEEFVLKVYALSIRERPAFYPPSLEVVNKFIHEKTPDLVFVT